MSELLDVFGDGTILLDLSEFTLRHEADHELWKGWIHAAQLHVTSKKVMHMMTRVLVNFYWDCVGRRKPREYLLALYNVINCVICYRMLTEPRHAGMLFTPHLVDANREPWGVAYETMGLPPAY